MSEKTDYVIIGCDIKDEYFKACEEVRDPKTGCSSFDTEEEIEKWKEIQRQQGYDNDINIEFMSNSNQDNCFYLGYVLYKNNEFDGDTNWNCSFLDLRSVLVKNSGALQSIMKYIFDVNILIEDIKIIFATDIN